MADRRYTRGSHSKLPAGVINQFKMLDAAIPKVDRSAGDTNLAAFDPRTSGPIDAINAATLSAYTPETFIKGRIMTGYVLRSDPLPLVPGIDGPPADLQTLTGVDPHENTRVISCMIVDGRETELLPYPNSYGKTRADEAIINSYPTFQYDLSVAGDITVGGFVKCVFIGDSLDYGVVINPLSTVEPVILAELKTEFLENTGLLSEEGEEFFLSEYGPMIPQMEVFLREPDDAAGELATSTIVIDEEYFHPARWKVFIAKKVNELDDRVKFRFARAIKRFITEYVGTTEIREDCIYDFKPNSGDGYRSSGYRTFAQSSYGYRRQPDVYAPGGQSWHNWGLAMDTSVWVKGYESQARSARYETQIEEQLVVDEAGNPETDEAGNPTGRTEMVEVQVETRAAHAGGDTTSGPAGCTRCEQHGTGWWNDESNGAAHMGALRNAMMTEKLFNPIEPPITTKHDRGHFQPIELPTNPPQAIRPTAYGGPRGGPTIEVGNMLLLDPTTAPGNISLTGSADTTRPILHSGERLARAPTSYPLDCPDPANPDCYAPEGWVDWPEEIR